MPWASGLSGKRLKIRLAILVFVSAWIGGLEFLAAERDHLGGPGRTPRSQGAGQGPQPRHGLVVGSRSPQRLPPTWEGRKGLGKRLRGGAEGDRNPGRECGSAAACTRAGTVSRRGSAFRESGALPPRAAGTRQRREAAAVDATVPLAPGLMCHCRSKANPARTSARFPFPVSPRSSQSRFGGARPRPPAAKTG